MKSVILASPTDVLMKELKNREDKTEYEMAKQAALAIKKMRTDTECSFSNLFHKFPLAKKTCTKSVEHSLQYVEAILPLHIWSSTHVSMSQLIF